MCPDLASESWAHRLQLESALPRKPIRLQTKNREGANKQPFFFSAMTPLRRVIPPHPGNPTLENQGARIHDAVVLLLGWDATKTQHLALAFVLALAFLSVIPRGNLLLTMRRGVTPDAPSPQPPPPKHEAATAKSPPGSPEHHARSPANSQSASSPSTPPRPD
jgi:hypothetical protein